MENFDWKRIEIIFPEFIEENFTLVNDIKNNCSKTGFYVWDYWVGLEPNKKFPHWIKNNKEDSEFKDAGNFVEKVYKKLLGELSERIKEELFEPIKILDSWKELTNDVLPPICKGYLNKVIYFGAEHTSSNLFSKEYGKFFIYDDSRSFSDYGKSLTDVLLTTKNVSIKILNERGKLYQELAQTVVPKSEQKKGVKNLITGKTLTECIQNADKIYKLAPELSTLKY